MDARKLFSRIGWIYVFFIGYTTLLQVLLIMLLGFLSPYLPEAVLSGDMMLLFTQIIMYGLGFPVFARMMRSIPSCCMTEPKNLSIGQFLAALLVCFGATYIGNLIGSGLMGAVGRLTGSENTNPLTDILSGMNIWTTALTTVIIAPVMEELMFRKYLVDRLVPYGQRTAVVMSGVLFGLFHGNFYQFFYATILGMIFAYIYSSTGRIRYNIALHMMINIVGGVISILLLRGVDAGLPIAYAGMTLLGLGVIISIVAALVIFFLHFRKLPWFPGWQRPEEGVVRAFFTAPGIWGLLAVSGVIFALS